MSVVSLSRRVAHDSIYARPFNDVQCLIPYEIIPPPPPPQPAPIPPKVQPGIFSAQVNDFHLRIVLNNVYYSNGHDSLDAPPSNLHICVAKVPSQQYEYTSFNPLWVYLPTDDDHDFNYMKELFYKDSKNVLFTSMVDTQNVYDFVYSNRVFLNHDDDIRLFVFCDLPPYHAEEYEDPYDWIHVDYSFNVQYTVSFK